MGVRLKTVGGSTNWLAPHLAAASIKANDTGIADGIARGLHSIGESIERKETRREDKRRFDEQMALRVKSEQTEQDRFNVQFLRASILQDDQRLLAVDEEDPTKAQEVAKIRQERASKVGTLSLVGQRLGMAEADTLRADIDRTLSRPPGSMPPSEAASLEARYASPVPATGALPPQAAPGTAAEPDGEEGWSVKVAGINAEIEKLRTGVERFSKANNMAAVNKRLDDITVLETLKAPYELWLKKAAGERTARANAKVQAEEESAELEAFNKDLVADGKKPVSSLEYGKMKERERGLDERTRENNELREKLKTKDQEIATARLAGETDYKGRMATARETEVRLKEAAAAKAPAIDKAHEATLKTLEGKRDFLMRQAREKYNAGDTSAHADLIRQANEIQTKEIDPLTYRAVAAPGGDDEAAKKAAWEALTPEQQTPEAFQRIMGG